MKITLKILLILIGILYSNRSFSQCFIKNERILGDYTVFDKTDSAYINFLYKDANELVKKVILLDVKYGFYNDSDAPNAMAMPINSHVYDGQVYFGEQLISQIINNDYNLTNKEKFDNLFKLITVLAHEYAHVLQYKKNHFYKKTMYTELQADYIAGFYIGYYATHLNSKTKNYRDYYSDAKDLFEDLGDTNIGSPSHHGTPLQRKFSFVYGFNVWNDYLLSSEFKKYQVPPNSYIWNRSVRFIHYWYGHNKGAQISKKNTDTKISEDRPTIAEENNNINQNIYSEEVSNCVEYLDNPQNINWSFYNGKIKYKGCKGQKKARHMIKSNWFAIYEGKHYILLEGNTKKEIIKINKDLIKVYNVKKVSNN